MSFLQLEREWGGMLDGANSPNVQVKQDMEVSLPCFWRKVLVGLWQLQNHILKS